MEHHDPARKLYIGSLTPATRITIMDIAYKHDIKAMLKYNYNHGMPFGFLILTSVQACTAIYNELYENNINVQRPKSYIEPVEGTILIPGEPISQFKNYSPNLQEALRKERYSYSERLENINLIQLTEYERQIQLIYDEYVY